ncbi:GvpL/GvpF family gas vesicle protein [Actinacidiphila acididurans]|uniref:GvpL/GvpF family gas vesicle protein n=1 Tax=Actinacidiphila acididurans TaxID=2784346 RepID=A0ABS2U016_9ACTN|nr:GvpL/GvpF family gas vesicle protein [Actinacidiphila acididurans]MBM9507875.1 GvpL/GvpF family gas vesicle protein [Actinacidiphila acididurans]
MSLYVYGVTRGSVPPPTGLRGVGAPAAQVRTLAADDLAVAVSAAPARLRAYRRDLQAHQDVLTALARSGPVLPMRFGVVTDGEEPVLARLTAGRADYLAALDRIEGHVEMNVKAHAVEDGLADIVRQDPRVRSLRQEARRRPGYAANIRLGEAVAAAVGRRAAQAGVEVLTALTGLATETVRGTEPAGCALNASFLVAEGDVARFHAAVAALAVLHTGQVTLQVTGPLPCYSFAVAPAPAAA